ncbi:MAG: peptidyl-prolyl cis-trans isomerase [Rhizobiaceae bacterium]
MILRTLREPLFHFLLIGAVVFAAFQLISEPETVTTANAVKVTNQKTTELISQFRNSVRRDPTPKETRALIQSYVKEEVLVREALLLSLDKGDAIIRKRLSQKMNYIVKSAAAAIQAEDSTVRKFYRNNLARYTRGGAISFEQVFLGPNVSDEQIEAALRDLNKDKTPEQVGRPTLLPFHVTLVGQQKVDSMLGAPVYEALSKTNPGVWGGPVKSSFGIHLVKVLEVQPKRVPALEAIRKQVESDWRASIEQQLSDARIKQISERYTIVVPSDGDIEGLLK